MTKTNIILQKHNQIILFNSSLHTFQTCLLYDLIFHPTYKSSIAFNIQAISLLTILTSPKYNLSLTTYKPRTTLHLHSKSKTKKHIQHCQTHIPECIILFEFYSTTLLQHHYSFHLTAFYGKLRTTKQ